MGDVANELAWSVPGVVQETYFFALQLHAWLPRNRIGRRRRIRRINHAFGHQLFGALLDQQITACRLVPNEKSYVPQTERASYFPTHYGLFDRPYRDLVTLLARDLLGRPSLAPRIDEVLRNKRDSVEKHLSPLKPQHALTPPPGEYASGATARLQP